MELVRQKNVATIIVFPIVDADGDLVSGAAGLDSEIDSWADGTTPDGFADCTNEATEIGSTGQYYLSLSQSEMNADYIIIQVKTSTSGAKTQTILIRTMVGDPLNAATTDDGGTINVASGIVEANAVQVSGDAAAADNLEAYCDGTTPQPVNVTTWKGSAAADMTGDAYARIGAPAGASVSADVAAIKSDTGEILTDTGTTLPATLTTIDGIVDAILEDTGTTIPATLATIAGYIDTEVAAILAAVDTEIASIISTLGAAGAGLTAVPWNAAWDAEVQSECMDALNAYDPPTNAEMVARTLAAASYFDPAADVVAHVTLVDTCTTNTDMVAAAPTAAAIADAVWDEAQSGHTGAGTFGAYLDAAVSTVGGGSLTLADIADAVWDEILSGHAGVGSTGAALSAAGGSGDPWATALPGAYGAGTAGKIIGDNLNAPVGTVDTVVDAIKAKTDNLPAAPAAAGDIPAAAAIADAVWDEARSGHTGAGSFGQGVASVQGNVTGSVASVTAGVTVTTNNDKTGYALATTPPTAVQIRQEMDANSTQLAAIVADTNELQQELANGGRLDLLIDAILEDTAVIGAAGAGLTAIPWNAAWDAEVQSECTDALAAYDPPTNAEMVARTLAAADYATAAALATVDGIVDEILTDTGTTLPGTLATLAGYIDTEVAAILEDTGTSIPALISGLNDISAADVWGYIIEGTLTAEMVARIQLAVLAGRTTGGGTDTVTFRDQANTKPRLTAVVDTSGNRTSTTPDGE